MKRYWFASVTMFLVLFVAGGGFFFWQQLGREDVQVTTTVKQDGRVDDRTIIGIDPNYAPLEFTDVSGKIIGFDIDLINAAFAKMGEEYALRSMPWDKKDELLNSGQIDIIWSGLNISDERKKIYEFSVPYVKSGQLIYVAAGSDMTTKYQMANKRIGIPKGSFTRPMLEEFSRNNIEGEFQSITEFSSLPEALVGILTGKIDVVVGDSMVGRYYTSNSPGKFRVLAEPFSTGEGMAVAAKKGNREAINKINKVLNSLEADGTLSKINEDWFGK